MYAAQPHVIHHTTVVQPNSIPSTALYPAPVPVPAPRNNGMTAMGMVAGTTMAMSAGKTRTADSKNCLSHDMLALTPRLQSDPEYFIYAVFLYLYGQVLRSNVLGWVRPAYHKNNRL